MIEITICLPELYFVYNGSKLSIHGDGCACNISEQHPELYMDVRCELGKHIKTRQIEIYGFSSITFNLSEYSTYVVVHYFLI